MPAVVQSLDPRSLPAADPPSSRALLRALHRAVARLEPGETTIPPVPPGVVPRYGAVLVLLYRHAGQLYVALTRRTADLRSHSGEISLPGGSRDPADLTLLDTALRETREELGVGPAGLQIWGQLRPIYVWASNFVIVPYVAYRPRRPRFRPSPGEVAEVLEVPFAALLDPSAHEEEVWFLRGQSRRVAFFRFGDHKIWGATARILAQLVHLVPGEPEAAAGRLVPGQVE